MLVDQSIITKNAQETTEFGRNLARELQEHRGGDGATVLCLYGELGSGKTTFTQGFAKGLGITHRLLSPTFIIVRRYQLPKNSSGFLYHLDLYRLQLDSELEELGLSEMFADSESFVVIEWAEKLTKNLPEKRMDISFTVDEQGRHRITLKSN